MSEAKWWRWAAVALCGLAWSGCEAPQAPSPEAAVASRRQEVVYGEDDRLNYYAHPSEALRRLTRESIVAAMGEDNLDRNNAQDIEILGQVYGRRYGLCQGEPFYDEPVAAGCSGTLIDDDLVLTAGHCVDANSCDGLRYVFDFYYRAEGALETVSSQDVYSCAEVLARALEGDDDYAVVRLDRAVVGRQPAPVTASRGPVALGQPAWIIGFGNGLPAKLDDGGRVGATGAPALQQFKATVDAFGGNSGSGVFNAQGEVIGILVAGREDYVTTQQGCRVVNRVADDLDGENIVYVHRAVDALCATGHPSARLCPQNIGQWCSTCAQTSDCVEGWGCRPAPAGFTGRQCAPTCARDADCRDDHACLQGWCSPRVSRSCAGDAPVSVNACGQQAAPEPACGGDSFCQEGACAPRVAGDTCAAPIEIEAASQTLRADLRQGAQGDAAGSCGGQGPELVYHFALTGAASLRATATGFDTVLHLRRGDCAARGAEALCNDDTSGVPNFGSRIEGALEPGDYFLFVDAFGQDVGAASVALELTPACDAACTLGQARCAGAGVEVCEAGPQGCPAWVASGCAADEVCQGGECVPAVQTNVCDAPPRLTARTQRVQGLIEAAGSDTRGTCGGEGAEAAWRLDIPSPVQLSARVEGLDAAVYLRQARCLDSRAEAACGADGALSRTLEAGAWYLFVDASPGAAGPFALDLTVSAACAQTCQVGQTRCADGAVERCAQGPDGCAAWELAAACGRGQVCASGRCQAAGQGSSCDQPVVIEPQSQIIQGDFAGAFFDLQRGACGDRGAEKVYAFSLEGAATLRAQVQAEGGQMALYLQRRCGVASTEQGCALQGSQGFEAALTAGDWFLWVDGGDAPGLSGRYTLSLDFERPCQDACALGESSCDGDGVRACALDPATGCLSLGAPSPCAQGQICQEGACVSGCAPTCDEDGALRCASDSGFQRCRPVDGCLQWSRVWRCAQGEVCDEGRCLPVDTCQDACDARGARQCVGDGLQICQLGESGCLEWSQTVACGPEERCQDGICAATCEDACAQEGLGRCEEGGASRCARGPSGCLEWSAPSPCALGSQCEGEGACVAVCRDRCASGALRCAGDLDVEICARGAEGCLEWRQGAACEGEARCAGPGICVPRCEDSCQLAGERRCDGDQVQSCVPGPSGCLEWAPGAVCADGLSCQEGACVVAEDPDMGDPDLDLTDADDLSDPDLVEPDLAEPDLADPDAGAPDLVGGDDVREEADLGEAEGARTGRRSTPSRGWCATAPAPVGAPAWPGLLVLGAALALIGRRRGA